MCGIAGIVTFGPGERGAAGADEATARAMAATLGHRGPDASSAWVSPSGRCALGHTRLSVIDLATGDQPMPNEDGSVQVVYNGEIYNFRELRAELEAAGHRFRSRSDTEVLAHGYEEWGDALPERVDGMFAFAVWDERRRRLLLARDRAGQKPLYVARRGGAPDLRDAGRPGGAPADGGGALLFGSEIKAILAAPGVDDALDPAAFPFYLAYGYVPAPGTFYRYVYQVPPGTLLALELGAAEARPERAHLEARRYWRLRWSSGDMGDAEALAGIRSRVEAAVERRLVADVPLGAFLSGGVDSSIVVGVMSRLRDEPTRTFSLGFADDPSYDETAYAREVAERFGTDHTEFTVEAHHVDLIDALVEAHDQPFGDSSAIPTYLVSRMTRERVTVSLTGDGGDELFAGYIRFQGARVAAALPGPLVALGRALGGLVPHHPDFRHPTRRFTRFFEAAASSPEERTLRWIGYLPTRLDEVLRPEVAEAVDRGTLLAPFRAPLEAHEGASTLARQLALNFETYLPEDLLVKADRCSMAHGLELRSPFLDTELMEFAAGLPDRVRIRGRTMKWGLREAFRDLLPGSVLTRGKMGFGVPLPVWFRTRWKGLFEDRVLAPERELWRWLRREGVEALWKEHQGGNADHGHALWALLTLAVWLERKGGG